MEVGKLILMNLRKTFVKFGNLTFASYGKVNADNSLLKNGKAVVKVAKLTFRKFVFPGLDLQ